jgi:hypothetical protein
MAKMALAAYNGVANGGVAANGWRRRPRKSKAQASKQSRKAAKCRNGGGESYGESCRRRPMAKSASAVAQSAGETSKIIESRRRRNKPRSGAGGIISNGENGGESYAIMAKAILAAQQCWLKQRQPVKPAGIESEYRRDGVGGSRRKQSATAIGNGSENSWRIMPAGSGDP